MAIFDYFRFTLAIAAEFLVTSLFYRPTDPYCGLFTHFYLRNRAKISQELILLLAFDTHTHTYTQNLEIDFLGLIQSWFVSGNQLILNGDRMWPDEASQPPRNPVVNGAQFSLTFRILVAICDKTHKVSRRINFAVQVPAEGCRSETICNGSNPVFEW